MVRLAAVGVSLVLIGCGMSDEEVRQKAGDAAVAGKKAIEAAGETMKQAYDSAAEKGKQFAAEAGEKIDDAVLKGKVLAAFRLIEGLDYSNIIVEAKDGKVFLAGTVPTQMDKWKAEGVAFGVSGGTDKYKSTIQVKPKTPN